MINLTKVPARTRISVDQQTANALRTAGALIVDDRRRRSFFFDGRFLTARDLTREQTYFLTRQTDLGRAGGTGVVVGLGVAMGSTPTTLAVGKGSGLTPMGELVAVPDDLVLDVADIADIERLDASFGLAPLPRPSARARTGLFVMALRPVEFTANPIASYPTTLGGKRTIEDGDIVEAVAVTLVPYPDQASNLELDVRRARAALEIFSSGTVRGMPADALPLAMIALDHGVVHWVDMFLVRREVGAEPLDIVGLGRGRRAIHEAHLLQYQAHLADVLQPLGSNRRFAASAHFFLLPPAGTLPTAAVNPLDFTQIFFPPEIDVSLAVIPADELAPLVEESLMLPPIDLTLSGDELASTSVLILAPLPRDVLRRVAGALPSGSGLAIQPVGQIRSAGDIERLVFAMAASGATGSIPASTGLADPTWRNVISRLDPLWYVRRRNLPYKTDIVGEGVDPPITNVNREGPVLARLTTIGLDTEYQQMKAAAAGALDEALLMLSSFPGDHVLLFAGTMHALRSGMGAGQLTHDVVIDVASRFTDPDRGAGLARLEDAFPDLKTKTWALPIAQAGANQTPKSGSVLDLDGLASRRDDAGLTALVNGLKGLGAAPTAAAVATFVVAQLALEKP